MRSSFERGSKPLSLTATTAEPILVDAPASLHRIGVWSQ